MALEVVNVGDVPPVPMNIGGVQLVGVVRASERGGQHAPEKRVEKGFDYSTYVRPELVAATVEARVDPSELSSLKRLRSRKQPFPVTVGTVSLGKCKLEDLSAEMTGEHPTAPTATIKIRQVFVGTTGSAALSVSVNDGKKSQSSASTPHVYTNTDTKSTSGGPNAGGIDPIGDIAGWLGF